MFVFFFLRVVTILADMCIAQPTFPLGVEEATAARSGTSSHEQGLGFFSFFILADRVVDRIFEELFDIGNSESVLAIPANLASGLFYPLYTAGARYL